jgi:hypothetical protein
VIAALPARLCVETGNPTFHRWILFFWLIIPVNSTIRPVIFLKGNRDNTLQHNGFSQNGAVKARIFPNALLIALLSGTCV